MMAADDDGFLTRWARRKAQVQGAVAPTETVTVAPDSRQADRLREGAEQAAEPAPAPPPPAPTMEDVASLTTASDYSRFVAPGVDGGVRNAAMKKLFSDPHFNVMDRLDTYIDDYSLPDPIPESMLRQMVQANFLDLFGDKDEREALAEKNRLQEAAALVTPDATALGAPDNAAHHEDTDLQLQPHNAPRRPGPGEGAGPGES